MKIRKDVPYGTGPFRTADFYLPDGMVGEAEMDGPQDEHFSSGLPVLPYHLPVYLYFHGGGLEAEDKAGPKERAIARTLCDCGIAVVSANYSLYPSARYPDFLVDAAAAVKWILQWAGTENRMWIGGSSAGAYLAMMLCFDDRLGISDSDVAGYVFDAGQPTCHFNVLREMGLDPRRVVADERSPVFHVKDGRNYPPMLILVAENELPGRREQLALLCSALDGFGYRSSYQFQVMKGYGHCQYLSDPLYHSAVINFITKQEKDHESIVSGR